MTDQQPRPDQPTFIVTLRARPGVNAIHALRALLKTALRRFGFQCLSVHEEPSP